VQDVEIRSHGIRLLCQGNSPVVTAVPATSDEAIRVAAKVAIDVGEYERARALLNLLEVRPQAATVVPLPLRGGPARE
jgi:hypothetical protein